MCEYPLAEWVLVDRSEVLLRGLLVDIVFLVFLFLLPVDVRGDATVLLWEPWGVLYAQVLVCLVVMLPDVDILLVLEVEWVEGATVLVWVTLISFAHQARIASSASTHPDALLATSRLWADGLALVSAEPLARMFAVSRYTALFVGVLCDMCRAIPSVPLALELVGSSFPPATLGIGVGHRHILRLHRRLGCTQLLSLTALNPKLAALPPIRS